MKLVQNASRAWRWFSVQAMTLAAAVQATWVLIPDDMRGSVPSEWVAALTVALLVMGVLGRLIDQSGKRHD